MIKPRLDKLLERADSDYACVLVAAKRARQINSYYHNLGEGTFDEFPPPMVESASKNYLTIALELVDQYRRAGNSFECRPPDEREARGRLHHPHGVAGAGGEADQLDGLVRGDPTGDAEQDPRHLGRLSGSGT